MSKTTTPHPLHSFPTRRSSDLLLQSANPRPWAFDLGHDDGAVQQVHRRGLQRQQGVVEAQDRRPVGLGNALRGAVVAGDRKSTRLNSSHVEISYAVFCLKKKMS